MKFLVDYWYIIVAMIALLVVAFTAFYIFFGLPNGEQQKKVKEWLIWACIEAEKSLQTGTGKMKLRKVYDAFITIPSFNWIARVISFDTFSSWVEDSLKQAKKLIIENPEIAKYVYGDNRKEEIAKLVKQLEE